MYFNMLCYLPIITLDQVPRLRNIIQMDNKLLYLQFLINHGVNWKLSVPTAMHAIINHLHFRVVYPEARISGLSPAEFSAITVHAILVADLYPQTTGSTSVAFDQVTSEVESVSVELESLQWY